VCWQTRLNTLHGGVVHLKRLTGGGDITASVVLDTARVQVEHSQGRDHYYIETIKNQRFSLFATQAKVQNNQVVAG